MLCTSEINNLDCLETLSEELWQDLDEQNEESLSAGRSILLQPTPPRVRALVLLFANPFA